MAIRPKTLFAALTPIVLSWGLVINEYGRASLSWSVALLTLIATVSVQILSNLVNDYEDFKRGADEKRIGPTRVMQAGLVSEKKMLTAILFFGFLTFFAGICLTWRGSYPIFLLTLVSILCAWLYTGGPYPLGYLGLGEIFAFAFFGPIATGASYYLQTLELPKSILFYGLAPGCFSAALLLVNNLRDVSGDRVSGKKTIVVRFGERFGRSVYILLFLTASVIDIALAFHKKNYFILMGLLFWLVTLPAVRTILKPVDGPAYNRALARTGLSMMIFSLLIFTALLFRSHN